jgi:hypothetical protein
VLAQRVILVEVAIHDFSHGLSHRPVSTGMLWRS